MRPTAGVLLIEDGGGVTASVRGAALASQAGDVLAAADPASFADYLHGHTWRCAVLCWPLSWHTAADIAELVLRRYPDRPLFVIAETADHAGRAQEAGATLVVGATMRGAGRLEHAMRALQDAPSPSVREPVAPQRTAVGSRADARNAGAGGDSTAERAALVVRLEEAPGDDPAWDRLIALDRAAGDPRQLAETLHARIPHLGDLTEKRRLSKSLLAVCIDSLRDGERAIGIYLWWRQWDPDNEDLQRILLDMLERLQRWQTWADVVAEIAERASEREKIDWLKRLVDVQEHQLGDAAGAARSMTELLRVGGPDLSLVARNARLQASARREPKSVLELVRAQPAPSAQTVRRTMAVAAAALRATGPIDIPAPMSVASQAAAIAHDLSAPARAVARYLEAVLEDHGDELGDSANELLGRALAAAGRLQDRVSTTLGGATAQYSEVDVGEVLRDVMADLCVELEAADATVKYDALPVLYTDRSVLTRVIQNLVANAVHHGGSAPTITVSALARDDGWELLVQDDGPGLPNGISLFEPGARGDDDHDGAGLGLAICRDLVNGLGGRIGARSGGDGGTTIHFTVPHAAMAIA